MKKAPPNSTNIIYSEKDNTFVGITFGEDITCKQHSSGLNKLAQNFQVGGRRFLQPYRYDNLFSRELLKSKILNADEGMAAVLWDDGTDLAFVLYPKNRITQMNLSNMEQAPKNKEGNTLLLKKGPFCNFIDHQTYSYNRGISKKNDIIPYSLEDKEAFIQNTQSVQTTWDSHGFIIRARGDEQRKMIELLAHSYITKNLTISMGIPGDIENQYYQIPVLCVYSRLKKYYNDNPNLKEKLEHQLQEDYKNQEIEKNLSNKKENSKVGVPYIDKITARIEYRNLLDNDGYNLNITSIDDFLEKFEQFNVSPKMEEEVCLDSHSDTLSI